MPVGILRTDAQRLPEHLRLKRSYWTMETSEPQERMPHVENVRLVKEAKSSDAGATGFDGRSALLPFGLAVLAVLAGVAYLLS
jgi:hypothetical protein